MVTGTTYDTSSDSGYCPKCYKDITSYSPTCGSCGWMGSPYDFLTKKEALTKSRKAKIKKIDEENPNKHK